MDHFPPRRILAALDGSEESLIAWEQAEVLAARTGASYEGIYIQSWRRTAWGLGVGDPAATAAASEETLDRLRGRLGRGATVYSLPGEPARMILEWSKSRDFDLVVMGTHGRTGLARSAMGSVSEAVVHSASVPVLVCRRVVRRFASVLAPFNFMPYAERGLEAAAAAAGALGARLELLTALDAPSAADESSLDGMRRLASERLAALPAELRRACKPSFKLVFGEPVPEILREAEGHDLIVLTAHVKRLLHDWALGTTAERVLRHSRTPVLAVPCRTEAGRREGELEAAAPR